MDAIGILDELRQYLQRLVGETLAIIMRSVIAVIAVLQPSLGFLQGNQAMLGGMAENILEGDLVNQLAGDKIRF